MKLWHDEDGEAFRNSELCFGREYNPETNELNMAKISIRGRFPASGYLYNEEAHEIVVITRGEGSINVKAADAQKLRVGDVVHFAPMERVYWDGDMDMIVSCSPAFDPDKHKQEKE